MGFFRSIIKDTIKASMKLPIKVGIEVVEKTIEKDRKYKVKSIKKTKPSKYFKEYHDSGLNQD